MRKSISENGENTQKDRLQKGAIRFGTGATSAQGCDDNRDELTQRGQKSHSARGASSPVSFHPERKLSAALRLWCNGPVRLRLRLHLWEHPLTGHWCAHRTSSVLSLFLSVSHPFCVLEQEAVWRENQIKRRLRDETELRRHPEWFRVGGSFWAASAALQDSWVGVSSAANKCLQFHREVKSLQKRCNELHLAGGSAVQADMCRMSERPEPWYWSRTITEGKGRGEVVRTYVWVLLRQYR